MSVIENIRSCQRDHISQLNKQRTAIGNNGNSVSDLAATLSSVTGDNKAGALFHRMPSQNHIAGRLFLEMAREHLPTDFNNSSLSKGGEKIKNLLGIIASEVKKEDKALFDNVCKRLTDAKGKDKDERKVAKDLSTLMEKYGEVALNKVISKYTEHCREAWRQHHIGHDANTPDEVMFREDLLACHEVLEKQIEILTKHDQSWVMMTMYSSYFEYGCMSLAKTLRNYDASAETPPVEPVEEQAPPTEGRHVPDVDPNKPQFVRAADRVIGDIHIAGATAYGGNATITHGQDKYQAAAALGADILKSSLNDKIQEKLLEKLINTFDERAKNEGNDSFIKHVEKVSVQTNTSAADRFDSTPRMKPHTCISLPMDGPRLVPVPPQSDLLPVTRVVQATRPVEPSHGKHDEGRHKQLQPEKLANRATPTIVGQSRPPSLVPKVEFVPSPGAFTGKAANVDRIVTTQPIYSHMNRQDPTPQHFNRPLAPLTHGLRGTTKPKTAQLQKSGIQFPDSSPLSAIMEESVVTRHQNLDDFIQTERIFIDSDANDALSLNNVDCDKPALMQQNTIIQHQQGPQPQTPEKQSEETKIPSWRTEKSTLNTLDDTGNLTGYKGVQTTWPTVDKMNHRDQGRIVNLIPKSDGNDNKWIRQGKSGTSEEHLPQNLTAGLNHE